MPNIDDLFPPRIRNMPAFNLPTLAQLGCPKCGKTTPVILSDAREGQYIQCCHCGHGWQSFAGR